MFFLIFSLIKNCIRVLSGDEGTPILLTGAGRDQPAAEDLSKWDKVHSKCHGHCCFIKILCRKVNCIFQHLFGCSKRIRMDIRKSMKKLLK